ncbi:Apoptosis-resistant E3 ubiquitin protein ligase 1 [Liparis tanakae]|uniref:HECT-type E3 ubiquitin transferase n=1 Tax=Liparis tanakae TaxID=230148 RepID=A0A4Z2GFJ8_9TELE|nr:Apoptosis-resistant E3 ubiquitin protein ligase 1 [Liparis tanakae]
MLTDAKHSPPALLGEPGDDSLQIFCVDDDVPPPVTSFKLLPVAWIFFWEVRWRKGKESQIEEWLQGHSLSQYRHLFEDVQTLEELSLSALSRLEEVVTEQQCWRKIAKAHIQLLRDFAFQEWLCSQSLGHYYHTLKKLRCRNLDDLAQFDSQLQLSLAGWGYYYEDYIKLSTGIKILQNSRRSRDQDYEIRLVHSLALRRLNEKWTIAGALIFGCTVALCFLIRDLMFYVIGGITVSIIAFVFTIKFLCELAARVVSFLQNEDPGRRGDRSIYDYVRGNYLDPRSCKVFWDWKEPQEVGQTISFGVQLFYKNGQPFPAHRPVGLRVNITHIELALDIPVTQEVLQDQESNVVKIAFTVRKAGRYEVAVKLGGLNVAYSPYYKIFQPGTVVPCKTKIAYHFSTLVLTNGQQHTLQIEPRDEYGNPTSNSTSLTDEDNYSVHVHSLGTVEDDSLEDFSKSVTLNKQQCQVLLKLTLRRTGCFRAHISYKDEPLSNGEFNIIVHPNAERPALLRLKMYEFAGRVVGKCLYESALGGAYKQLVRARFTRSFLAQIIGLRMNYKYFEADDQEFYKTKVCFILNNDVSEMDLVFAEEKYSKSGQLEKIPCCSHQSPVM